ncbi:hemin ABC transporter substrate-binding protein [Aeromicrobium halocynthiae]|uniref:Hemin ABC transporter substrate-binding protein n=1 Tax=Aeromicrobium halocynthiae TaxID=560557 RepID=A0ABN2VWE0_9ACTN
MRRVALALLALLVLAGCAAPAASSGDGRAGTPDRVPLSEVEPLVDPAAHEGPSTAVLADRAIEPVAEAPDQTLPVTVTSYDRSGPRDVTITDTDRVLALDLSGSLAATVWGLGLDGLLVGRDGATTFAGSEDLPVVTNDGHSLNAESILRARPTLVVTDGSVGPRDVVQQLRDAGVQVVFLERESSFEGASRLARDMGQVLGVPAEGQALAERIEQQVADVGTDVERLAPDDEDDRLRMVFLYLRGSAGVYYLLGEDSGADDLIRTLGGVDVAGELGWRDVQPLTDEAVVAADPDLVLVMTSGLESVGGIEQLLQDKPVLALTSAGKNRRFVDMADGDVLSFGPRSADVLDALARAVYAPDR